MMATPDWLRASGSVYSHGQAGDVWWTGEEGGRAYMLNKRNEENHTVFYACLACLVTTFTLNVYVSISYTGGDRQTTLFIFLWLRHRNT